MIEIIPAIDVIDGQCVRLTQGDYAQKSTYFKDPLDAAKMFEDIGVVRLHLVDLDGAKSAVPKNLKVLEKIASRTTLKIEFGGGIKSEESLRNSLNSGAERVICGSLAVKEPELFADWLSRYGPDSVVLGADARNGKVAVSGWLEDSAVNADDLIAQFAAVGLKYAVCTDISKDGMLCGPAFVWYEELQAKFPATDIIVSGGISSVEDIQKLEEMNLRSVIVGKAFYEGRISLKELGEFAVKYRKNG